MYVHVQHHRQVERFGWLEMGLARNHHANAEDDDTNDDDDETRSVLICVCDV